MIRILVIILLLYLLYKLAKYNVKRFLFGPRPKRKLDDGVSLVKCHQCERFTDKEKAWSVKGKTFCCQECVKAYTNR